MAITTKLGQAFILPGSHPAQHLRAKQVSQIADSVRNQDHTRKSSEEQQARKRAEAARHRFFNDMVHVISNYRKLEGSQAPPAVVSMVGVGDSSQPPAAAAAVVQQVTVPVSSELPVAKRAKDTAAMMAAIWQPVDGALDLDERLQCTQLGSYAFECQNVLIPVPFESRRCCMVRHSGAGPNDRALGGRSSHSGFVRWERMHCCSCAGSTPARLWRWQPQRASILR